MQLISEGAVGGTLQPMFLALFPPRIEGLKAVGVFFLVSSSYNFLDFLYLFLILSSKQPMGLEKEVLSICAKGGKPFL